ncbi:MAG: MiaB/RimO family radical SAM methylthiotransferase [Acidimicrobiales bacterium]
MEESSYWIETLGCPKNEVDSEKLVGVIESDGLVRADGPSEADLVVVNTCAFIEAARRESVDTILELSSRRREGSRLVVTGCMAERYGKELAESLPEVDLVAGFGCSPTFALGAENGVAGTKTVAVKIPNRATRTRATPERDGLDARLGSFDLLELPRPAPETPWAYVKVAEGCDRICGFCAIPSFRGRQRSRPIESVVAEVESMLEGTEKDDGRGVGGIKEIVLVAQDLAAYGRDRVAGADGFGPDATTRRSRGQTAQSEPIVSLTKEISKLVPRTRLLYLYPSGLTDELVDTVVSTGVSYFDLSLQHVSRAHLRRMRRWGDAERFMEKISEIRSRDSGATFRSSFILGYPGETESDHQELLDFLEVAELDWAGFFTYSREDGTYARDLPDQVPAELAMERLRECTELQDAMTAFKRDSLVGEVKEVLVDSPGVARSVHEAPEIDGIVEVPKSLEVGRLVDVVITGSLGTDLTGEPVDGSRFEDRDARSGSGD